MALQGCSLSAAKQRQTAALSPHIQLPDIPHITAPPKMPRAAGPFFVPALCSCKAMCLLCMNAVTRGTDITASLGSQAWQQSSAPLATATALPWLIPRHFSCQVLILLNEKRQNQTSCMKKICLFWMSSSVRRVLYTYGLSFMFDCWTKITIVVQLKGEGKRKAKTTQIRKALGKLS